MAGNVAVEIELARSFAKFVETPAAGCRLAALERRVPDMSKGSESSR